MNTVNDEGQLAAPEVSPTILDDPESDVRLSHADLVFSPLAFMRPRFLRPDPELAHLPFLFWLVDVLRPNVVVQLGLGLGTNYFGLCQALDKFDEGAVCFGMMMPEGSGEETPSLPPEMVSYNAQHYREFSVLIGEDAQSATACDLHAVDLLIVDGAANSIDALIENWLPRLSERAIIVVRRAAASANAIDGDRPIIETREEDGLRVILHGPVQDDRLRHMAALTLGTSSHSKAWQIFRRLGSALVAEAKVDHCETALAQTRARLEATEKRAATAEAQLSESMSAWSARQGRTADLEAKLFDLESGVVPAHEAATAIIAQSTTRIADLENEIAALRTSEAARFEELAALARMIEMRDAQITLQAQAARLDVKTMVDADMLGLKAKLELTSRRLAEAELYIGELLGSSSWKLTAPLRRVTTLARRRG